MPKKLKKEIENLAAIVKRNPDGVSIDQLLKLTNHLIPKRTLQYRLSILVEAGILRIEGSGRSIRYHFIQVTENKQKLNSSESEEPIFRIPLTAEGKELQKKNISTDPTSPTRKLPKRLFRFI